MGGLCENPQCGPCAIDRFLQHKKLIAAWHVRAAQTESGNIIYVFFPKQWKGNSIRDKPTSLFKLQESESDNSHSKQGRR